MPLVRGWRGTAACACVSCVTVESNIQPVRAPHPDETWPPWVREMDLGAQQLKADMRKTHTHGMLTNIMSSLNPRDPESTTIALSRLRCACQVQL